MSKKGPLGKAEQFYIESKYKEVSLDDLCKELDRAKTTVNKHIEKCKKKEQAAGVHDISSQFAKNDNGATVMTPNASEMSDSFRAKIPSIRQVGCTTSIKNE